MRIWNNGLPHYHTRRLRKGPAFAFARCLSANRLFTGVEVWKVANDQWVVTWLPATVGGREAVRSREQSARGRRSREESVGWSWQSNADGDWEVTTTGGSYVVGVTSCSCPDYRWRGTTTGIPCKHMLHLAAANRSLQTAMALQENPSICPHCHAPAGKRHGRSCPGAIQ